MTHKKINYIVTSLVLGMAIVAPAFAQTAGEPASSSSGAKAQTAALVARTISRADQEIDRRITSLNALAARIEAIKKISDSQKSSLTATIQTQVNEMTSLKAKIDADTDPTTLRADVQSIAKTYRIYRLVIPQGAVIAAADRILTVADGMATLGAKLQARISAAQASGTDVSAMQSAYADFTSKLSDANTQANAAISAVSSLTPDNGDQAKLQANTAALKDARTKVHAAQQDLVAARKDASAIVKDLRVLNTHASSSAAASGTAR